MTSGEGMLMAVGILALVEALSLAATQLRLTRIRTRESRNFFSR